MGIGAQDDFSYAQEFLASTGAGTSIAMLWSSSFDPWRHFSVTSNSSVLLLDRGGEAVDSRPGSFDAGRIEGQLAALA